MEKEIGLFKYTNNPKLKIIWNITKICAWDCEFCCIDAYHVCKKNKNVLLRTKCLTHEHSFIADKGMDIFEAAKGHLIKNKMELSLAQKLNVLENINMNAEIDFSGGDPLLLKDNIIIIENASKKFGKENVHITATGIGFSRIDPTFLSKIASRIDFTFDAPNFADQPYRPKNYNSSNLKKVSALKKTGINIMAQIPLTNENIAPSIVERIYMNLHSNGIDKLLLMKFNSVGRGAVINIIQPNDVSIRKAIDKFKSLEAIYKYPIVKIQTALMMSLEDNMNKNHNFASLHYAITPMGLLSSSPWAFNKFGEPLSDYILGDLSKTKVSSVLNTNLDTNNKKGEKFIYLLKAFSNKAASIFY